MGEHGARADQAVALVDVQIIGGVGIELGGRGHFQLVLGQVGLQPHLRMRGQQFAGHGQLLRRTGDGEAGRHRIAEAALAGPVGDQLQGLPAAILDGVEQVGRGMPVHQHLAGDQPHVSLQRLGKQRLHRALVHRAEHQGCGGAVAQQLGDEEAGRLRRVRGIGEGELGRKDMPVQPVEQLGPVGGDDVGLWKMHVQIHEPGRDQPAREAFDRCVAQARREVRVVAAA